MNFDQFFISLEENSLHEIRDMFQRNERDCVVATSEVCKKIKIGHSKVGGDPHVPNNFEWPESVNGPLAFVAQINLLQLPHKEDLPESGMLYFFYDQNDMPWGFDPKDKDKFAVIFLEDSASQLTIQPTPKSALGEFIEFPEAKLVFKRSKSYPSINSELINLTTVDDDTCDLVRDLWDEFSGDEAIHQVFGFPDIVQTDDMEEQCQLASNGINCGSSLFRYFHYLYSLFHSSQPNEWLLLFQCDTDDNACLMWGDLGKIFYWIKATDLKSRNFKKCWLVLQCG